MLFCVSSARKKVVYTKIRNVFLRENESLETNFYLKKKINIFICIQFI